MTDHFKILFKCFHGKNVNGFFHQLIEPDGRIVDEHFTSFNFREVENVVDDLK